MLTDHTRTSLQGMSRPDRRLTTGRVSREADTVQPFNYFVVDAKGADPPPVTLHEVCDSPGKVAGAAMPGTLTHTAMVKLTHLRPRRASAWPLCLVAVITTALLTIGGTAHAAQAWAGADLTALTGVPAAASAPFGYTTNLTGQGPVARVVYRTTSGHIEEFSVVGDGSRLAARLTTIADAADAPFGYTTNLTRQGPVARVSTAPAQLGLGEDEQRPERRRFDPQALESINSSRRNLIDARRLNSLLRFAIRTRSVAVAVALCSPPPRWSNAGMVAKVDAGLLRRTSQARWCTGHWPRDWPTALPKGSLSLLALFDP